MTSKNDKLTKSNQNNLKDSTKGEQGGFVAVLHSLEEQFYGPDSPINLKGRVLLYLRHRSLRDWTTRKQIPKSEIIAAVHGRKNKVEDALRELEKEGHLLVTRTKVNKVWNDNIYELHPKRYGTDYVFRPEKPSLRVIYGSKGHPSNPKKLSTHPTIGGAGVPPEEGVGLPPPSGVGNVSNISESLTNSAPKNPLKEPIKKTLSEAEDFQSFSGSETEDEAEAEAAKRAKELIRERFPWILKSVPQ